MSARGKFGDVIAGADAKRRGRKRQGLVLRLVNGVDAVALRIIAVQGGSSGWRVQGQIHMEIGLVVLARPQRRNVLLGGAVIHLAFQKQGTQLHRVGGTIVQLYPDGEFLARRNRGQGIVSRRRWRG